LEPLAEPPQPGVAAVPILDELERAPRPAGVVRGVVAVEKVEGAPRQLGAGRVEAADPARRAHERLVCVYMAVETLRSRQVLDCEPRLPGIAVRVAGVERGCRQPERFKDLRVNECLVRDAAAVPVAVVLDAAGALHEDRDLVSRIEPAG